MIQRRLIKQLYIFLIFLIISQYLHADPIKREIHITISNSSSLQQIVDEETLFETKKILNTILLEGRYELNKLSKHQIITTGNLNVIPLFRDKDSIIYVYHYGETLKNCIAIEDRKYKDNFLKCLPGSIKEKEQFFVEKNSPPYISELEILKKYDKDKEIFWIDINSYQSTKDKDIPSEMQNEWDSLHTTVVPSDNIFKITFKNKWMIVLRKLEAAIAEPFKIQTEDVKQGIILSNIGEKKDNAIQLQSKPFQLIQNPQIRSSIIITELVYKLKTTGGKEFILKKKSDNSEISKKFILEGYLPENEAGISEQSGVLHINYLHKGFKQTQTISNVNFTVLISKSKTTSNVSFQSIAIVLGILAGLLVVLIIVKKLDFSRIGKKGSVRIRIYTLDNESINPQTFYIQFNEKIAFSYSTGQKMNSKSIYDVNASEQYIELLTETGTRLRYTNQTDPSRSKELIVPADLEIRDDKGKLIKLSIEVTH